MPRIANLAEASQEDVDARLAELKNDFVNLDEGRRAEIGDAGLRSMIDEVNILDNWNTISRVQAEREKAKLAATAGALTEKGTRSLGEELVTEEMVKQIMREAGGQTTVHVYPDGRRAERQYLGTISFENDEKAGKRAGSEMSQWLRYAGIYGGNSEGVRAVTEWGSSGPGAGGTGFDPTDSGGLLPRLGQPIPPTPRHAKLYLRDLIPSMSTTLATMPYVRELNPTTFEAVASGGATTVAEGSTKPTAQLSFVSENAPLTVIASTLTLSKQMFEDAPAVVQYINQRLPYLVKFREDAEFLNGSGTWPDIQGITNAGIQSITGTSGEHAISIGTAFADVENVDGAPTAVVMNPTDAWAMFTKRAAGGSGTFDAGTPFSALPLTVWGVPTYRSRAYAAGSALAADFERGAMVVDREQVNVQVYRERYAEQNLILLICEERVGLMTFRPDLFVSTTIP